MSPRLVAFVAVLAVIPALAHAAADPLGPSPKPVTYFVRSTLPTAAISGPHAADVLRVDPRAAALLTVYGPGVLRVVWFQDFEPRRGLPQGHVEASLDGKLVRKLRVKALPLPGQKYSRGGPPASLPGAPAPFDLDVPAGEHTITLRIAGDDRFGAGVLLPGSKAVPPPADLIVLAPLPAPLPAPPLPKADAEPAEEELASVGAEAQPTIVLVSAPMAPPRPPGEPSRGTRPNRPVAWAATGLGGVCVATGAVFGTLALLDNGGRVNPTGDDHGRARTEAHAADALYGVGVVALGVGVWLLMRRDG